MLYAFPDSTIIATLVFFNFFYLATDVFKFAAFFSGLFEVTKSKTPEPLNLKANDLPMVTVMVPMYKEKESAGRAAGIAPGILTTPRPTGYKTYC